MKLRRKCVNYSGSTQNLFSESVTPPEKNSATAGRNGRDRFHLCHHHDRDHHCTPRVWQGSRTCCGCEVLNAKNMAHSRKIIPIIIMMLIFSDFLANKIKPQISNFILLHYMFRSSGPDHMLIKAGRMIG